MAEREATKREEARESDEERRSRQSAREVTEWEAAFAAAKGQGASDRANAGAIVSRAHRAEKSSGQSPGGARPQDTSTRKET